MSNRLVEIPRDCLHDLQAIYEKAGPEYHLGWNIITNFIKWFDKDSNICNVKAYSLNGDWTDGTFLIIDRYMLLMETCSKDYSRLKAILSLIDWSYTQWVVWGITEPTKMVIDEFLKEKSAQLKKEQDSVTICHEISKEAALSFTFEVPEGFHLKPLSSEEHAEFVNSHWPHRHDGSLYYIKRLIRMNDNIGLFKDGETQPAAWCLRLPNGALGALQVRDEYKRRGFGSLIVKAISRIIAAKESSVFAFVVIDNHPSRNMFRKMGFEESYKLFWLVVTAL